MKKTIIFSLVLLLVFSVAVEATNLNQARVVSKARVQQAKANIQDIKLKVQEHVQTYRQIKENRNELRQQYKDCVNTVSTTEECQNRIRQYKGNAKTTLEITANITLDKLEQLKETIGATEYLAEEEITLLLENIDVIIENINEDIDNVRDLTNASERQEIQEVISELRQDIQEASRYIKRYDGYMLNERARSFIAKEENLYAKLDRILTYAENNSIDTTELEPLVTEYNSYIGEAKESYAKANEYYLLAIPGDDDFDDNVKAAQQYFDDMRSKLDSARTTMQAIHLEIVDLIEQGLDVEKAIGDEDEEV